MLPVPYPPIHVVHFGEVKQYLTHLKIKTILEDQFIKMTGQLRGLDFSELLHCINTIINFFVFLLLFNLNRNKSTRGVNFSETCSAPWKWLRRLRQPELMAINSQSLNWRHRYRINYRNLDTGWKRPKNGSKIPLDVTSSSIRSFAHV